MKIINDYIEKIGGADKMIHQLVGENVVANFAFLGLLVGVEINPMSLYAIVMSVMVAVIIAMILLALFSDWKEKKDEKEPGDFYDGKDIEAAMRGGVRQMIIIIVMLVIAILIRI